MPLGDMKATPVGFVPNHWTIKRLADVTDKITVGIASAATHAYRSTGVPLLRNQNIKQGFLDDSDVLFVDPDYEETYRNKRLQPGDLLIARTGYPGTACVVPARFDRAQSFTTLIARPTAAVVDSSFLCHFINSTHGQAFFTRSQIGGAQKNVNAGTLREMTVPLPPLLEQRAIATALSDVDELIAALDELIAKKRDLKTAAMQQLLTGKRRLPGFTGPWETKRLGERGTFSKGKGIRKDDVLGDGLPCLRYGEIYTHHNDVIRHFCSFISREVARGSVRLRHGDIVFAGSGETAEEIGKCVAFVDDTEAYVGSDTVVFNPSGDDSVFLAFLLNHHAHVVTQRTRMGQGDAVVHIGAKNLAALTFAAPPVPEQSAIATVLLDLDAEIAAVEARRDKTKLIKQGMMQELLTGRTRLVEPTT